MRTATVSSLINATASSFINATVSSLITAAVSSLITATASPLITATAFQIKIDVMSDCLICIILLDIFYLHGAVSSVF